ncbi:MAG: hypothetical protein KDJ30_14530, partial [Rhodoblastus sp.]|nr:hypothetical protein [Rhodoblastus sp.]
MIEFEGSVSGNGDQAIAFTGISPSRLGLLALARRKDAGNDISAEVSMSARPALQPSQSAVEWRGLAIGVEERNGRFLYRVRMVHDDPLQAATLVQTEDEREAVAAWRYWSASLRLPRLV